MLEVPNGNNSKKRFSTDLRVCAGDKGRWVSSSHCEGHSIPSPSLPAVNIDYKPMQAIRFIPLNFGRHHSLVRIEKVLEQFCLAQSMD